MVELHLPSVQSSPMALSAYCVQGLVPVLQSGAAFGLKDQTRDAITLKCRVLPLYLPFEKLLLVGGACSQTLCLPQHTAGATDGLVCVVIFLSRQESLWSGSVPVGAA